MTHEQILICDLIIEARAAIKNWSERGYRVVPGTCLLVSLEQEPGKFTFRYSCIMEKETA